MSVSFCLPHPVAVSAFMICRGLCACTDILWMCVLYVSFGSKVRPRYFGCVAMGSAFSMRLCFFSRQNTFCMYGCIYLLAALVLVCVDVMVMSCA